LKEDSNQKTRNKRTMVSSLYLRCGIRSLNHICLEDDDFQTNWDQTVEKFDDLSLKEEVLRGIYGYGFVKPSPIQQKGILPLIQGKDTIAQVIFYIK